jgi:hypothetical protein
MSLGHDSSGLEPIHNLSIYNNPYEYERHGLEAIPRKHNPISSVETNTLNQELPVQPQSYEKGTIKLRKSTIVIILIVIFLLIAGLIGGLVGGLLTRSKQGNSVSVTTSSYVSLHFILLIEVQSV